MKLTLLAIAASVGLAIAAPSFAVAATGQAPKTAVKPPVKKHVRKHLRLQCAKPVIVKGKPQCPTTKAALPK